MRERSSRAEMQQVWKENRKKLVAKFGDDRDALALAEILVLRQMAMSAMAMQTMEEMISAAPNKKLTR